MPHQILLDAVDVRGLARTLDGEIFIGTALEAVVGDVVDLVVRLPRGQTMTVPVAVVAREPWSVDREQGLLLRPLDDGDPLPGILHDLSRGRLHAAEQRLASHAQPIVDSLFADASTLA